jgi:glycosyltransferase involved in cell wall biosynthesis
MKWPSNIGYAIAPLERLFFDAALQLAGNDVGRVHFAYPDLAQGPPASLPPDFSQVHRMDISDVSSGAMSHLASFVKARKIDLVITFDIQPVHPVFPVLRRNGVSTIVSYWGAPMSSLMPFWKLALKRMALRLSRSKLDGLIFESQAMADLGIYGRGVPRRMIDIVPLGVDIERFKPCESTYVHEVFGIPRNRKVVVFSGHCTPRKGIGTLVAGAVELLAKRRRDDVCFLVCGNRGDESKEYEAVYAGLGIDDRVVFAGYRNDLLPIMQSAYCGLIPSSGWDSFPRSAVEMSATGLPIVASRLQGLAEAVLHEQTGLLFEPGNPLEMADALERMLDNPELAQAYGRRGRERCERELNLGAQFERFTAALGRHLA